MPIEVIDGVTSYTKLYTDDEGFTWNVLVREGGSLSLYGTWEHDCAHHVVYDTLDGKPPNLRARRVMHRLNEIAQAAALLNAAAS